MFLQKIMFKPKKKCKQKSHLALFSPNWVANCVHTSLHSRNVHYITRQGQEQYVTMLEYPNELDKKMKLLTYFRRYMTEHLMKAGQIILLITIDHAYDKSAKFVNERVCEWVLCLWFVTSLRWFWWHLVSNLLNWEKIRLSWIVGETARSRWQ